MDIEILNAKQTCLSEENIREIVGIECHPKVREWLYEYVSTDEEKEFLEYREFFRKLPDNGKADVLVALCNGRVVGFLALWRLGAYMEHVATIGVSVHPDFWRMGVASRLVESAIGLAREKGIRRLEIETLSDNLQMRGVAERLGFKLEGLRKNRVLKDGTLHDEVAYSMLL